MTNFVSNIDYEWLWYDNEWGYSNRVVDLTIFIGNKLKDISSQKVGSGVLS